MLLYSIDHCNSWLWRTLSRTIIIDINNMTCILLKAFALIFSICFQAPMSAELKIINELQAAHIAIGVAEQKKQAARFNLLSNNFCEPGLIVLTRLLYNSGNLSSLTCGAASNTNTFLFWRAASPPINVLPLMTFSFLLVTYESSCVHAYLHSWCRIIVPS